MIFGRPLILVFCAVAGCGSSDLPRTTARPDAGDADAVGSSSTGVVPGDLDTKASVAKGSGFAAFCAGVKELALEDDGLETFRTAFCGADGKPTRFFARTLPAKAYAGVADPVLLRLAEPVHEAAARTTAVTVAGAVVLTSTAQQYFEAVTGFTGDPEGAKARGVQLIDGTVEETVISQDITDSGAEGLAGTWEKRVVVETEVTGQKVRSEYEYHAENYRLAGGKAFLIVSHLTKSIKGVKGTSVFAAVIQTKDRPLLLTGVWTKTENRGMPDVAKDTLVKIIKQSLKNIDGISKLVAKDAAE